MLFITHCNNSQLSWCYQVFDIFCNCIWCWQKFDFCEVSSHHRKTLFVCKMFYHSLFVTEQRIGAFWISIIYIMIYVFFGAVDDLLYRQSHHKDLCCFSIQTKLTTFTGMMTGHGRVLRKLDRHSDSINVCMPYYKLKLVRFAYISC